MIVQRPRYAMIERVVEKLLKKHESKGPPISVEHIARAQGCTIKASDLRDVSGILVRSEGGNIIGVNSMHSEARRRFTIAHELGHLILHEGEQVRFDKEFRVSLRSDESSAGTNVEEMEANFFAASLLMPDAMLAADQRAYSIELEDVESMRELANAYKVSMQAMTLRLARLVDRRGRSGLAARRNRFAF